VARWGVGGKGEKKYTQLDCFFTSREEEPFYSFRFAFFFRMILY